MSVTEVNRERSGESNYSPLNQNQKIYIATKKERKRQRKEIWELGKLGKLIGGGKFEMRTKKERQICREWVMICENCEGNGTLNVVELLFPARLDFSAQLNWISLLDSTGFPTNHRKILRLILQLAAPKVL